MDVQLSLGMHDEGDDEHRHAPRADPELHLGAHDDLLPCREVYLAESDVLRNRVRARRAPPHAAWPPRWPRPCVAVW